MSGPYSRPIAEIAAEEGISQGTLYNWRKQARERGELNPNAGTDAEGWSARDKFAAVLETASMNEAERAEYCRPRVSDDNAFIESLFRICKYMPDFPRRGFASLEIARR